VASPVKTPSNISRIWPLWAQNLIRLFQFALCFAWNP
jgi:hypothetical protein